MYKNSGYDTRKEYLESLAEDYGIDVEIVFALAAVLGSTEDFDGLISALEDMEDCYE